MAQKFTDNGRALLMGSIVAGDTTLTVEASKADRYPVATTVAWITPLDWFKAVLIDSSGNREVIKVGTRTAGSGVFGNVLRAQDGTTARNFAAGSAVILSITAIDIQNALAGVYSGGLTVGGIITQQGVAGRVVPVGGAIIWTGLIANIPAGWQLANGTSGTPDLRNKFVIGAALDGGGVTQTTVTGLGTQTGGSTDAVVVAHTHAVTASGTSGTESATHGHTYTDLGHNHNWGHNNQNGAGAGAGNLGGSGGGYAEPTSSSTVNITIGAEDTLHTHAVTVTGTAASSGGAAANANLPPYYAQAYIVCMA